MSLSVLRRRTRAVLIASVLAATTLVPSAAAGAAPTGPDHGPRAGVDLIPTSASELQAAFASCEGTLEDPFVVALDRNLVLDDELIVQCTAVLLLEGHLLEVLGSAVAVGERLTIDDTTPRGRGRLHSDASFYNGYTGIGVAGAELVIERGHVTARGGAGAAGIGGGYFGDGGRVFVNGGVVHAVGGAGAAGIGGGLGAGAGLLIVEGGVVTARSSGGGHDYTPATDAGAAVGGGDGGPGSKVYATGRGRLVLLPPLDADPDALSSSLLGGAGSSFGQVLVTERGRLHLAGGVVRLPLIDEDDGIVELFVSDLGRVLGSPTRPGAHAVIRGRGEIELRARASLWLPGDAVRVRVYDHYRLNFDTAGGSPATLAPVKVFADKLGLVGGGARLLPTPPTKPGMVFTGWTARKNRSPGRPVVTLDDRTWLYFIGGTNFDGRAQQVQLTATYRPAD